MTEIVTSARLQAALKWLPRSAKDWAEHSPSLIVALTEAEAQKDMRLDGTTLTPKLRIALTARLTQRQPDGEHTLFILVPSFEAWCMADLEVRALTEEQPSWKVHSTPFLRFDATYWRQALSEMPDILVITPRMLEQAITLHIVDKAHLTDWIVLDSDAMAQSSEKASLEALAAMAPAQRQTWLLGRGDGHKPCQALADLVHTPLLCKCSDMTESHDVTERFVLYSPERQAQALSSVDGKMVILCDGPSSLKRWATLAESLARPVFKLTNLQTESAQEKAIHKWLGEEMGILVITPAYWPRVSQYSVKRLVLTHAPEGYDVYWHFYRGLVENHGSLVVMVDDVTTFSPMVEALGVRVDLENYTDSDDAPTEMGSNSRRARLSIKAGYVPKVIEIEPQPEPDPRARLREREEAVGSILDGREVRARKKGKKKPGTKPARAHKRDTVESSADDKPSRKSGLTKRRSPQKPRPTDVVSTPDVAPTTEAPMLDTSALVPIRPQEASSEPSEQKTPKTSRLRTPRQLRQKRRQGFKKPKDTMQETVQTAPTPSVTMMDSTPSTVTPTAPVDFAVPTESTGDSKRRPMREKRRDNRKPHQNAKKKPARTKRTQPTSHQSTWDGQPSSHLSSWEQGQAKHRRQDAHQWRDTPSGWDGPTSLSLPQSTPGLFGDRPRKGKGKPQGGPKSKTRFMRRNRHES